jgi:hypothetical protein
VNWLKRLFGVKTDFQIMLEHMERTDERYSSLVRAQMATIDRVVTARYDRPTFAQESPMPVSEINVDDLVDVNVDDDQWISKQ